MAPIVCSLPRLARAGERPSNDSDITSVCLLRQGARGRLITALGVCKPPSERLTSSGWPSPSADGVIISGGQRRAHEASAREWVHWLYLGTRRWPRVIYKPLLSWALVSGWSRAHSFASGAIARRSERTFAARRRRVAKLSYRIKFRQRRAHDLEIRSSERASEQT